MDKGQLITQWQVKQLSDVCDIDKLQGLNQGLPYVGMEHIGSANAEFLGSMEPTEVKSSTFVFTDEHILYGRLRPYLNKVLMPSFNGHCSTEIFPIKPKSNLLRKFLLYWFLSNSVVEKINKTCTGARMPRANMKEVMSFDIFLPPLPEQKRIVAILDKAFAGIRLAVANAEKNLANARELYESYLNNVFTQKGNGWEEKCLDDECDILMGQSPAGSSYNSNGEGVPLINGPVEFGGIGSFSKTVNTKFTTKPTKMCMAGDLILCVRGSTTGRMNIAGHDACIGRGVAAIRSVHNQDWINQFISFSRQMIYRLGSGATFPNVSASDLKKIIIPFPPVVERDVIVKKIEDLDFKIQQLEAIYQQKLTALNELKQSILQKAFTGHLTDAMNKG